MVNHRYKTKLAIDQQIFSNPSPSVCSHHSRIPSSDHSQISLHPSTNRSQISSPPSANPYHVNSLSRCLQILITTVDLLISIYRVLRRRYIKIGNRDLVLHLPRLISDYFLRLSPGIDALVKKLHEKNKAVYLVSGGFRQMINPVATLLGIPLENIYANQLQFGSSGEFSGFDPIEPTSRSGGKAVAVQQIRKAKGFKSLVMIGDGATDL